jgi:hypothetical protein
VVVRAWGRGGGWSGGSSMVEEVESRAAELRLVELIALASGCAAFVFEETRGQCGRQRR